VCSEKLEAPLSEALRGSLKPLLWEIATPIELVKDLKRDDFSAKLEATPNEALSVMLRALC
jgi:hypothetical protein